MRPGYFYGYNIVAAGFVVQAVSIGAMFTFGVFFKEFQSVFGWSRALISGASSLAFFVMGACAILAGMLNDRIGPRILVTASGVFLGTGYILMSRLQAPWQLYTFYGGLVGIGFATHDVITLSTVARWFVRRRGLMSGLVKVGTGAGQLVVPMIAMALIAVHGWRNAYMIMGITSLAVLVLVAQLMKRDPTDVGLIPDGKPHCEPSGGIAPGIYSSPLRQAFRSLPFWILCMAEFTIFFCLLTTIVHIVPHAQDQGLQPAPAAAVLATIGGVSMLGRIVMGAVNDQIGGKRSLSVCFVILIASLVWLQMAAGAWMLFLFAVVYGFAHGGFFTVMSPTVAEFFGTEYHGMLFGVILFCGTIGGSIGPLLVGGIFDWTGSYRIAFWLLTALAVTGIGSIVFLHSPGARKMA